MDLEQTVKDLQAQNSQFQHMFLTLAKGQEDLKTLLIEENKKKAKKVTYLFYDEWRCICNDFKEIRDLNLL